MSESAAVEEAQQASKQISIALEKEGAVLLKNENNALPLQKNGCKVTLLGYKAQNIQVGGGGSGSGSPGSYGIPQATLQYGMEQAGFIVNTEVLDYYAEMSSDTELSPSEFPESVKDSYKSYNDAAILVFARTGSEGSDLLMSNVTGHSNAEDHYLQLSDAEIELVKEAKANFPKVIVLLNTGNVMEMGDLNEAKTDDNLGVDAILWIGHVGNDGAEAIGKLLNGEVSPSGHTVDIWPKDFKQDPTWTNFGSQTQVGLDNTIYVGDEATNFHAVEYREGIYIGYRYYETVAADMNSAESGSGDAWYSNAVVYPFGYGLSYTDFQWELCEDIAPEAVIESANSTITLKVKVTNVGKVSGKDVVQVYATAPYTAGGIEKAHKVLVGYAKTDLLKPGQSEIVTIQFVAQDMASFDWNDQNYNEFYGYELEAGTYTLTIGGNSHDDRPTVQRIVAEDILCPTDYATGAEITPVFSQTDGKYEDFNTTNDALLDNMISRENGLTQPAASTKEDRTYSQAWLDAVESTRVYNVADDQETDIHYVNAVPEGWTQAASHAEDYSDVTTKIFDMSGVDFVQSVLNDGEVTVASDEGTAKWEAFLNQLTWEELCQLASQGCYARLAVPSIGMIYQNDVDGPAQMGGTLVSGATINYGDVTGGLISSKQTLWVNEVVIASTWNQELAKEQGIANGNEAILACNSGWYGPGANTHRSPFGGRNFEYYSEDPYLSGTIGAAVVAGATEKGLVVYAKHMFLNDQETNRGAGLFSYVTEQTIREIYLRPFEYMIKQGGAMGFMEYMGRLGNVPVYGNYAFNTDIMRREFGFKGILLTDAWSGGGFSTMDYMLRSGLDLPLGIGSIIGPVNNPEQTADRLTIGEWNAEKNMVYVDGVPSPTHYYAVRTAAQHVLYATANCSGLNAKIPEEFIVLGQTNVKAGGNVNISIDSEVYILGKVITMSGVADMRGTALGAMYGIDFLPTSGEATIETLEYVISEGSELPEGLVFADDKITGSIAQPGTYSFGITVQASGTASFFGMSFPASRSSEIIITITVE